MRELVPAVTVIGETAWRLETVIAYRAVPPGRSVECAGSRRAVTQIWAGAGLDEPGGLGAGVTVPAGLAGLATVGLGVDEADDPRAAGLVVALAVAVGLVLAVGLGLVVGLAVAVGLVLAVGLAVAVGLVLVVALAVAVGLVLAVGLALPEGLAAAIGLAGRPQAEVVTREVVEARAGESAMPEITNSTAPSAAIALLGRGAFADTSITPMDHPVRALSGHSDVLI